jgi:hypothetical protein
MKKIFSIVCMLMISMAMMAQAQIKFDKTAHDFGNFSEENPIVKCTFTFTNTGDKPLVINQAVASCGCTVAAYTKTPIAPGQKGEVSVTYNGTGKPFGHFKKNITVRTNGAVEMTRLYIEGEMTE